jgi:FAD/FMN-containing dehydrogenase
MLPLSRSAAASELLPACILVPQTVSDVSEIVKTLRSNNEQFAIKGGGHCPNLNFSSIANGPLISMHAFTEVTYNASTGSVRVGSGNRWENVQTALDPLNVTVVGGRIGHVGVGGYMLGRE